MEHKTYLKRRRRLVDAGLQIIHSRLRGTIMLLSVRHTWEPLDLDKAEKHFFPEPHQATGDEREPSGRLGSLG